MIKPENKISTSDVLNSYNFSRHSSLTYAEIVSNKEFEQIKSPNIFQIYSTDEFVMYKLKSFEIFEDSIIFCNTALLKDLFIQLKKSKHLRNIKLITHQSDIPITKNLFNQKPSCIADWFGVNIEHKDYNLHPIPLGIANNFQKKYFYKEDIKIFDDLFITYAKAKMYINFQKNTNLKERNELYSFFASKDWVDIDEPNLSIENYEKRLNKSSFVLCPWGNGIDTHRIWESLYMGKIPITKYHHTFSNLSKLPILFVDNYKEIDKKLLSDFINKYDRNKYDLTLLNTSTWINQVKVSSTTSIKVFENFNENAIVLEFRKFGFNFKNKIKSKVKVINYYINQLKKINSLSGKNRKNLTT